MTSLSAPCAASSRGSLSGGRHRPYWVGAMVWCGGVGMGEGGIVVSQLNTNEGSK